ncbi:hypothetical protein [Mesorhizobium sp.]|uniref:hypothetical protein n=1 Tax=Mesorhizobium sp. TaxID=1871066 RepID=UPI000FE769FB|nr:hypothetical protein [Mesorhizobium sp.]RWP22138.1 MAG: hypothetical protein EOR02_34080 [Mesorhizobium sp.]RWQ18135.1 MAG: hypothetical protein EOS19_32975 [Mesorhizobium sp.]
MADRPTKKARVVVEDDLLDVITVATTGIVCFFIALIFGLHTIPALLCGGAGSAAQAALICALGNARE